MQNLTRTACRCALLLISAGAVLGCSHQEFSRPALRRPADVVGDLFDSGRPYIEPDKPRAQQRMERLAQALAAWQAEAPLEAPDYLIGPGDELEVGIFALEAPDTTSTVIRTVSQDGYITLPWVGSIGASGLSARQLEERSRAAYAGGYIRDPQVTVTVTEYRSAAVVVTGAVQRPGVYYLTTSRSTVLAILAQAGGLAEEAGDELLIVRSADSRRLPGNPGDNAGGTVVELAPAGTAESQRRTDPRPADAMEPKSVTIDLKVLLDQGDLSLNLPVVGGDVITVPPRAEQYVYVLGYVQRPGCYQIRDGMRVDAVRAVALAGGLSPSARAENSLLLRETAEGQKVVRVDLTKIVRGVRPPLYMEPGDTLVVGSSTIAKMTEFIRPSVGAGIQYSTGQ